MADKRIYEFGKGKADGTRDMKELLGGKGANLAEMSLLGLPVPPGFTITTDMCIAFRDGGKMPKGLESDIKAAIGRMEKTVGAQFGAASDAMPLLVSVRSGARASMPGMMDTILNLGLNDKTVDLLAAKTDNPRFAWDSYRRFIQMYADVVLGVPHDYFEEILETVKFELGKSADSALAADDWRDVVARYQAKTTEEIGAPFPQDPWQQLWGAIEAVFASWDNARAKTYRALHDIPDTWGTAVNVQAMVFGNLGESSATGVAFTRNPASGDKEIYGEFLVNAQGEDVVAGIRTPQHLTRAARAAARDDAPSLEELMPDMFGALEKIFTQLEARFRDMQDIEFTVQDGALWILQTRSGKRTTKAALRILVDMVDEGVLQPDEALLRIEPQTLDQLLHPMLDPNAPTTIMTTGLPASPGAASGKVVFSANAAKALAEKGEDVILVRMETSPEDIHGMYAARGILTSRGGMTSHAAVVARGLGRPCVSGAGALRIDYDRQRARIDNIDLHVGDEITIDGASGRVMRGIVPKIEPQLSGDFARLMQWADSARRMQVRANAETPEDVRAALRFGAEGIGLCRTEHMFFDARRIQDVRQMILAQNSEQRARALTRLEAEQSKDFIEILRLMEGRPTNIRLLDPPLHEFLPHVGEDVDALAASLDIDTETLMQQVAARREANPMLGHRGCRLGVTYPEIYEMQVRAIFSAAQEVTAAGGALAPLEIMVPLVIEACELARIKSLIDGVAAQHENPPPYCVGSMIEVPRAALQAGALAAHSDFFSFGTNDLTQTCLGISRDDSGAFLSDYVKSGLLANDPFVSIDVDGVGQLLTLACGAVRAQDSAIKMGICGEHGGDPHSIQFCEAIGLDYISCSPYRLPIARLAAAQAALTRQNSGKE